jgi:hypothetical protein
LEEVVISFIGGETSGATVVIAGGSLVKAITGGQVVETEFGNEIASLFHFGVDATKGVPINCMKGSLIPVEAVGVVGYEARKLCFGADGGLEATSNGDTVDGEHGSAFRVEWYGVEWGGVFNELHGGEGICLAVHLSIEGKVSIVGILVLVAINVLEFGQLGEFIHEVVYRDKGIPFRVKGGTVLGEWIFSECGLFLEQTLVIKTYGESTCHRNIAELKGELNEGQTGTTAVGFCSIRARIVAEDWARARDEASACKCTKNPAERSSSINSAAIGDEYDFG